jgi:hypothetical protein
MKTIQMIALLITALSNPAIATIDVFRCEDFKDSLSVPEAEGRRAWALKCFPKFKGRILGHKDMKEQEKLRPGYPTFGIWNEDGTPTNPQNWFAPKSGAEPCTFPEDYEILSFCAAGCYTPEQSLWFGGGYETIIDAKNRDLKEIITLSSASDRTHLDFKVSPIDYFITDLVPGTHEILTIYTLSGGHIRVTEEHPLVDGEGRMRSARSLKVGESLVTVKGDSDPIISIESGQYFGKVYNVEVKTTDKLEKIVVAQGFLNGSLHFQNEGISDINRVLLRTNFITDQMIK